MSATLTSTLAAGTVAQTNVDANLREAPDLHARVLAVLPRGTAVRAEPSSLAAWRKVSAITTGQRGYVFAALLDPGAPPVTNQAVTAQSPLIAPARGTLAEVQDALNSRQHGLYSAQDIRFIARVYFESAVPAGLDPVIAIAQARLETGNFSSVLSQAPIHNFAGIGADDSAPQNARKFPTVIAGVRAHVGRLLAYAVAAGAEKSAQKTLVQDALAAKALPSHLRGSAAQVSGLSAWASAPTYVDDLCRVASQLADRVDPQTPPAGPRIITARSLGLSFQVLFGELGRETYVTGHYSAGTRARNADEGRDRVLGFQDDHRNKGYGGVAYHYVICDDGTLICARPTLYKGAHTKLHNTSNIGVNMPGDLGDRPTAAQAATLRWLLANAHTDRMPAPHRTDADLRLAERSGHRQWRDNNTDCPGDFLGVFLSGGEARLAPAHDDDVGFLEAAAQPDNGRWQGEIYVDGEFLSKQEAADARQPSSVEAVVPPADPRFDSD